MNASKALSRAKLLRPIVISATSKNVSDQPAKVKSEAAILSILGSASRASTKRGFVRYPKWWSLGSSCGELRNATRHFSNSGSVDNSGILDAEDAFNDDPLQGQSNGRQARWDRLVDALKEYKSIYGDTLVPATYPDNPPLGNWVDNTRQNYRQRLEAEAQGEKDSPFHRILADEKIEQLDSVGFVWHPYDQAWNNRYEELKAYLADNGNTLVPINYPENTQLGHWVLKQRRNYKVAHLGVKRKEFNETALTPDRIQKLNDIGFIWDVHEAHWLERFEDLKEYKANHGDTLVPMSYTAQPFLARWVDKQRIDYRRYMARKKLEEELENKNTADGELEEKWKKLKPTGMTEERMRLLEEEDFIWNPIEYMWESKFEELCTFAALNGHAAIFRKSKGIYDPLARWAETQRENYRKYQNGQKTSLTEDKINRLNAINFVWENSRKRRSRARKESPIE